MTSVSRRDILKLFGGLMGGVFLTPLPWMLLKDSSVLTQTGPWIAKVPHGPLSTGYSTCTLCPAGCGVRARCVAGVPFSLSAVANHPLSSGTLCAAGLAAHHSAYHPLRVRTPLLSARGQVEQSVQTVGLNEATSRLASAFAGVRRDAVAILDLGPGRTASLVYRKLLGTNGHYLVPPRAAVSTLDAMCETPYGPTGLDLEHAKRILSLGAPLLEVWGNPGQIAKRQAIIQVETRRSRTATLADEWIRLKPGSETALVLGLAHVIMQNGLCDSNAIDRMAVDIASYKELVHKYSPQRVAELTGVRPERIVELAWELSANSPAIVVSGSGSSPEVEIAVMGLNLLLGNLNREGGIVPRTEVPVQNDLAGPMVARISSVASVPDRSIDLLIIDDPGMAASLPWETIKQKLSTDRSLVVCFSPYRAGISRHADIFIPTPAPFESFADAPTSPDAVRAAFALAPPLMKQPDNVADPLEILGKLFSVPGTTEQYLRGRVEAIRKCGDGSVFSFNDGSTADVKSFGSADELWSKFIAGALWLGATRPERPLPKVSLLGKGIHAAGRMNETASWPERDAASRESRFPLTLMLFSYPVGAGVGQVSPLMTKVFQESGLRSTSDIATVAPGTANACGLGEGDLALLETARGSRKMKIAIDRSALPGVIHAAAGPDPIAQSSGDKSPVPDIASIVDMDAVCSWIPTSASLRKES